MLKRNSRKYNHKKCGFKAREQLGDSYWKDPEWKEVSKLRKEGKQLEANGMVMKIRSKWGLD